MAECPKVPGDNESTSGHATPHNPGTLRILIVEDHDDTAQSMALVLRLNGYDVQVATDGPPGLQIALATEPDVVVLDIGMPGMNGWDLAKRLREQKPKKRPLLIAVTGYGQYADRLRSHEVGIDLHLMKPADLEELDDFLQKYLSIKRG